MPAPVNVLAAALVLTAPPAIAPAPAHAAATISCHTSGGAEFSPGVRTVRQDHRVDYFGDERECVDHSDLGIGAARFYADLRDVKLSCLAGDVGRGHGRAMIRWDVRGTPLVSELDVTVTEGAVNTATATGMVVSGPFEGQRFTGHFDTRLLGRTGECSAHPGSDGVRRAPFKGDFSVG
ncbi:hypothetical protein SAMN05444920_110230 [Nonomuraea solani]|uniref:Dirigent-like protein n=1 Tax=Nonomuraea solani TaxID=1144553 RepID=A0A1H6EH30_9ACTN|nr:hypothetical protein [Nonomuraea solani]SEG97150.1 hypothetical protein SAMN05444920_110230 [Nonomuraea solani]